MATWAFSGKPRAASDSGVTGREGVVVEKWRINRDMNGGMMDENGRAIGGEMRSSDGR